MVDLARRSYEPELIDGEDLSYEEFEECLRQLEALNTWSLAYRPTLSWLARVLAAVPRERVVRIVDVGCGHGDLLRVIHRWGERRGRRFDLTGVDLSPLAARAAAKATPSDMPIRYETADVFTLAEDRRFDIVVSAIFTHHLDDDLLDRFLRWMEARASLGWFINDLHRHAVPYWFLVILFRLGRFNRLVAHDGPVSVRRAFTRADWEQALARAGLGGAGVEIGWYFPFRYGVGRIK